MKKLCKKPKCINNAMNGKEYCHKHQKEIIDKSELYFKEMKKDGSSKIHP